MNVALLTDTHFGVSKSSQVFLESSLAWFRDFFIPRLKALNINTIYHLGDLFDNRSSLDIRVLNEVLKLFREDLKDFNIFILVGNHDSTFRDRIDINSVECLREFSNVQIIDSPKLILDGKVALVPWVVNKDEFDKFMTENKPDITCGHFEVMCGKIKDNKDSIDPNYFVDKTKLVLSGHYHSRQDIKYVGGTIRYIGNTYHLTRTDIGEERGFAILNTDTSELEFINDESVALKYLRVKYPCEISKEFVDGNIVDVYVDISEEGYDEKEFNKYVSNIESYGTVLPPNVKIERTDIVRVENFDVSGSTSTRDILSSYVAGLNIDPILKEKVNNKINLLYDKIEKEE